VLTERGKWRATLRWLRTTFPPDRPVRIRYCNAHIMGDFTQFDDHCQIRLRRNLTHMERVDTILHEWAHTRADWRREAHGKAWGDEYRRIYQAWDKWTTGE